MPVPVPRHSKPVSHPVIKHYTGKEDSNHPSVFQSLTHTLPVTPSGPPPSFGTREEWINSLPSWRRTKPRRIWEDDNHRLTQQRTEQASLLGLTVASNVSVNQRAAAQACNLRFSSPQNNSSPTEMPSADHSQEQGFDSDIYSINAVIDQIHHGQSQRGAGPPTETNAPGTTLDADSTIGRAAWDFDIKMSALGRTSERGVFSPIQEDELPGREGSSSPIEPITPFGEFVDRAVAASEYYIGSDPAAQPHSGLYFPQFAYQGSECGPQCYHPLGTQPEQVKSPTTAPEVVTPSATASYKNLADPLADWISNFIWKVCTTGFSLPVRLSTASVEKAYSATPPAYLRDSVHSLLLSTLLQPSAVFLALWYIVRLPVYFGNNGAGVDNIAELHFVTELLGESLPGAEREIVEANAPFRLVLLGFMLANKWLDDHTFSNKTWHSISNIPIQSLNKLESLTLDIFSYDLSISQVAWFQWLSQVHSYHLSCASPSHPQPISRPSNNPHSIVRRALEELIQAPAACQLSSPLMWEPVFLGLEDRRKEKLAKDQRIANSFDVYEIDLDEDGPLREEYLPKRRVSCAGSIRSAVSRTAHISKVGGTTQPAERGEDGKSSSVKKLPPPAKWSPAGDEPILRERNSGNGHYVAVQAPHANSSVYSAPPTALMPEVGFQNWPNKNGYTLKPPPTTGYAYGLPPLQVAYNPYPFVLPLPLPHARSFSLSYDQENLQAVSRPRTYSQSRLEYRSNGLCSTAGEILHPHDHETHWVAQDHSYGFSAPYVPTFAPHPSVTYRSTWLQT